MKVVYFGSYNRSYPRNQILIEGLRLNGVEVIEVHDRSSFLIKYVKLFFKHWPYRHRYDFMIVGFPGFTVMPLARLIATAPVIFDAFLSLYDSNVFDRKNCAPESLRAKYYYFLDSVSCKLADLILLDTREHIKYFVATFGINLAKFRRIFVGAEDGIFTPAETKRSETNRFAVLFWGWIIPLHGVKFILEAARLLQEQPIDFTLICGKIGKETYLELKDKWGLKNVTFVAPLKPELLVKYIQQADVCLGIFGNTEKTTRVIPNKVYESLACRKAVITADTPAARELLTDRVNCVFCRPADAYDLAEKILLLKNSPELREKIAENGRQLYQEKLTPKALGASLLPILEKL